MNLLHTQTYYRPIFNVNIKLSLITFLCLLSFFLSFQQISYSVVNQAHVSDRIFDSGTDGWEVCTVATRSATIWHVLCPNIQQAKETWPMRASAQEKRHHHASLHCQVPGNASSPLMNHSPWVTPTSYVLQSLNVRTQIKGHTLSLSLSLSLLGSDLANGAKIKRRALTFPQSTSFRVRGITRCVTVRCVRLMFGLYVAKTFVSQVKRILTKIQSPRSLRHERDGIFCVVIRQCCSEECNVMVNGERN